MVQRPMVLKRRTHRGESQTGLVFYTKLWCSKCDFDFVPLFPVPTHTKIMQNVAPSTALCLTTSHTLSMCLGHLGELGIGRKIILKIISEAQAGMVQWLSIRSSVRLLWTQQWTARWLTSWRNNCSKNTM